jgi:hypothetical protein
MNLGTLIGADKKGKPIHQALEWSGFKIMTTATAKVPQD